jgi:hypothetical protein
MIERIIIHAINREEDEEKLLARERKNTFSGEGGGDHARNHSIND